MNFRQDSQHGRADGADDSGLVGGRFRVERSVGRGGMATVYEVTDLTTNRRLALKRMQVLEDPRRQRRSLQLFEREFHTLSHLAHPRVIEVYDYGVDDLGPYYTMELLDGGDLQQQAPVEWRRACALARDVCSALSLLHSRRMVYRDLSPRNVRCTSDGRAKLLDFGAMVMMGPSKQVVGTPAYCAPEALNLQPLDQRTDLYSLGATLYYTLLGRHTYPARDFAQLREQWRSRVVRPSSIVADRPPALDALVLDLMHLDPGARPANAAEVMERLAAIEGRALDEHLLVSQSYLSTPNLVGRELALSRARAKCMRAQRSRGGGVLIEGASGVGRSRFLDASLLEAKLLGMLVLRADAADAQGEYGVVRALATQLLEALPEAAFQAARARISVLGYAVPELLAREPGTQLQEFANADQIRANVQPALREWIVEVSQQRALMIAVDDLDAIDEPSAAFVALLAREVRKSSVLVLATVEHGARATAPAALQVLADGAAKVQLANLSADLSERLLRSVFGDVAHVQSMAHKLHAISDGNPRDLMQLAQHLLDRGLVRYEAGAWTLPQTIDAGDLPSNMAQALLARVAALSEGARELARAIALCPELGVAFDECVLLCDRDQSQRVIQRLDELVEAQVVLLAGERCVIARRGWLTALSHDLEPAVLRALHLRVAKMLALRGGDEFRVAQHLFRAGEAERGLDALIAHAEESKKRTEAVPDEFTKLALSMPDDWFATYADAIALCEQLGRPKRDAYALRRRVPSFCGIRSQSNPIHLPYLIEQLCEASGLREWAALDPAMEPRARVLKALALRQARYDATPEHERFADPASAVGQLARTTWHAVALGAVSRNHALLRSLPSLLAFAPLDPAMAVTDTLVRGTVARIGGRVEDARELFDEFFEQTARSGAGLGDGLRLLTRWGVMYVAGLLDAAFGLESSLTWAKEIEALPTHQVNAQMIRMVYSFWCGEIREAEECRERVELLRIQNSPRQFLEGSHLLPMATMHAASDDLTRIKQVMDDLEPLAKRHPGWAPVRDYAAGEYHRIRGDRAAALQQFELSLAGMQAGCHQLWPNAAGAHVRALFDLERYDEACERGSQYLVEAQRAGHRNLCAFIKMPLALALSKRGLATEAVRMADSVIEGLRTLGSKGVLLGLAYETRARLAIDASDHEAFARFGAQCAEQLRAGSSRVLTAKYEKLKQLAARAEIRIAADPAIAPNALTEPMTGAQLTSMLDACRGSDERAQQSLKILLRQCGVTAGFLYMLSESGPELVARVGDGEAPLQMNAKVREYIETEIRDQEVCTASLELESSPLMSEWTGTLGERFRLVLLSHAVESGSAITGVAVAVVQPGRRFVYPGPIAIQLSRILLESGDVVPAIVAA